MASTKRSSAVERARRTGIKAQIRDARKFVKANCHMSCFADVCQLLNVLSNVAEDYLKEVNHGN